MLWRTPTAVYILLRPGVHFKPIKGYALLADGNRGQLCPNLAIESILVHAQIGRGIAESDQAGLDLHGYRPRYTAVICSRWWPISALTISRAC